MLKKLAAYSLEIPQNPPTPRREKERAREDEEEKEGYGWRKNNGGWTGGYKSGGREWRRGEVKRLCEEAESEVRYLWYHTPLMMMTPLVLSPCRLAEYDSRRLPSFADVNLFRPDRKQSHCVNSTNPWVEPLLESFSPSLYLSLSRTLLSLLPQHNGPTLPLIPICLPFVSWQLRVALHPPLWAGTGAAGGGRGAQHR